MAATLDRDAVEYRRVSAVRHLSPPERGAVFTDLAEPKGRPGGVGYLGHDAAASRTTGRSSSSTAASCRRTGPIPRPGRAGEVEGRVDVVGLMRWSEDRNPLHPRRRSGQGRLVHPRPARHRPRPGSGARRAVLRRRRGERAGWLSAGRRDEPRPSPIAISNMRSPGSASPWRSSPCSASSPGVCASEG